MTPQCEAMVSEPPHYFHRHQCSRQAVREVDGKQLCRQHEKIALRRRALKLGEKP